MNRVIYCLAIAAACLAGPGATAMGLDLLAGRAGNVAICSITPHAATEAFGIPSRKLAENERLRMEFSHHGFVLAFPASDAGTPLGSVTVYAVDRDGYRGYDGHFLGTIANGTRSDPVRRLLRSVRADITRDEADRIDARLRGFELAIGFLYDAIDWVTLTCPAEPETSG